MLPFLIPGIGTVAGATTLASNAGIESIKQGMDVETAQKRTLLHGGFGVAMVGVAPLSGKAIETLLAGSKTAVLEVAKSGTLNIGLGVSQRAADWAIVKERYPEMADKMEVLSKETVGLDVAMWLAFAGLGYKGIRKGLRNAGVPLGDIPKTIRAMEETIAADSAVQDAIYVRRSRRQLAEEGPLEGPEAYAKQEAMVDDAMQRIERAEPMPQDVPEGTQLKATKPLEPVSQEGKVLFGEDGIQPLPAEEVGRLVKDIGLDGNRVIVHDSTNPIPDFIMEQARKQGGSKHNVEAWMGADGTLHINREMIGSIDRLKDVVAFHEITHKGQDAELLKVAQESIAGSKGKHSDALRAEVLKVAQERNFDLNTPEGTASAIKEATSNIMMDAYWRGQVVDATNEGFFGTLVNKTKDVLRNLGVKIEYNDADTFRAVGTMWMRGKERLTTPVTNEWRTIHDALAGSTYVRTGSSKGKYYTESDFQNHLKEFYPSVFDLKVDKKDVLAALKNLANGSSRPLTPKQREIVANFEYDLGAFQNKMVEPDVPFSIYHAAPYLRAADYALKSVGAEGEYAVINIPEVGYRQVLIEVKRGGKVVGYLTRNFNQANKMMRATADSALPKGQGMGILSKLYRVEDAFGRQHGLDVEGTYINPITNALARRGGAQPVMEGSSILNLPRGTEEGKLYTRMTPEDVRAVDNAFNNKALGERYEAFKESKRAERQAESERIRGLANEKYQRDAGNDTQRSGPTGLDQGVRVRRGDAAETVVKVDTFDEAGKVVEAEMKAGEAIKGYTDNIDILKAIADCLKGA